MTVGIFSVSERGAVCAERERECVCVCVFVFYSRGKPSTSVYGNPFTELGGTRSI